LKIFLSLPYTALPAKSEEEVISNGSVPVDKSPTSSSAKSSSKDDSNKKSSKDTENEDDIQYIEQSLPKKTADINSFDESADSFANEQQAKNYKQNGIGKVSSSKLNSNKENSSKKGKNYNKADISSSAFANNKDEAAYIQRYVL
jgi:hypothetical protein